MSSKKKSKEKKQQNHPVETCEIARGELRIFIPKYRRMPLPKGVKWASITRALVESNTKLWDIQVKTNLTLLHNVIFDAIFTSLFVNKTITRILTPLSEQIDMPAFVGIVPYMDIRKLVPAIASERGPEELLKILEEFRTNITIETIVIDKKTNKKIAYINTGLFDNFMFVPTEYDFREMFLKKTFKDNEKLREHIQTLQSDLNKKYEEQNWIKPKESDLLFVQISPVVPLFFRASKLTLSYSTNFIKKLSEINDGYTLAIVKYITSQQAPYTISTVKMFSKITNADENRRKWDKTTKERYKNFVKKVKANAEKLQEFNITYDKKKSVFQYSDPVNGVGFILLSGEQEFRLQLPSPEKPKE